jgi:ubiquitin thioesterase protein OTUB1
MAIEIFYDSLVEFIESLDGSAAAAADDAATALHTELTQENATSDYCTWYLRVLTATFLKADPHRFLPYLEGGYVDVATFCQQQIEPMGKECSMVQVLALAEAFQVKVEIEYLDGHAFTPRTTNEEGGSGLTKHTFGPSDATTTLTFLYRPGHYDILYPK